MTRWTRRWCSDVVILLAVGLGSALVALAPLGAQQANGDLDVIQVQPNFFMIAGAGGNIAVQVGPQGVVLVDSGSAAAAERVLAAIKRITDKPIRYILNTSADVDHTGGNAVLSKAGVSIISGAVGNAGLDLDILSNRGAASILAYDTVMTRLAKAEPGMWPTKTYTAKFYKMSLNGDGIEIFHQPAGHSDGDSFVEFRRANVIATGDLFDPTRFPMITADRGGSIQGVIDGLNHLLELAVPPYPQPWLPERTLLVPGHGRVSDHYDLLEYRDVVTIIRDRIEDMINRKMTLEQVKAANPTAGYTARYGATSGPWTTDMFVAAVYQNLSQRGR